MGFEMRPHYMGRATNDLKRNPARLSSPTVFLLFRINKCDLLFLTNLRMAKPGSRSFPMRSRMLLKKQHAVSVQSGAGRAASIPDAQFTEAGAQLAANAAELAARRRLPAAGAPGDAGGGGVHARRQGADRPSGAVAQSRTGRRAGPAAHDQPSAWTPFRASRARKAWTPFPAWRPSPVTRRCCWRPTRFRNFCRCSQRRRARFVRRRP
jgi:hypothetical protein